ncbi:hypothetical protein, partial [Eggerthella sp.]|uniref:hypothetical protein n=1 Tax=Eggerthella sp. TaxID=1929886 RepID=UPI0029164573
MESACEIKRVIALLHRGRKRTRYAPGADFRSPLMQRAKTAGRPPSGFAQTAKIRLKPIILLENSRQ